MEKLRLIWVGLIGIAVFVSALNTQPSFAYNSKLLDKKTDITNIGNEPNAIDVFFTVSGSPCSGSQIDVMVTGGVPPYQFLWSTGDTTEDISGVNPGAVSVTVTDALGDVKVGELIIAGIASLNVAFTTKDVSCSRARDGAVYLEVTGGVEPYTYVWSTGATTKDLTNVNGGNFTVKVTDANGCEKSITATVVEPKRFSFNMDMSDASCPDKNDGYVNVIVSGGSAPYSYTWSTGDTVPSINNLFPGTYSLTVTDRVGCNVTIDAYIFSPEPITINSTVDIQCSKASIDVSVEGGTEPYEYLWSNGVTTEDLHNLEPGIYSLIVTDSKGCNNNQYNVDVPSDSFIVAEIVKNDISCNGADDGSMKLNIIPSTHPYQITWSTGSSENEINGLTAGEYFVTILDHNNCSYNLSGIIGEPEPLKSTLLVTESKEEGGAINLQIIGGTKPYHVQWSDGSTTEDLSGLAVGTYSVRITDSNGCITEDTAVITGYPSMKLALSEPSCAGGNDGSARVDVFNGTMPYTYLWSNGATSNSVNNLGSGTYSITVTDSKGLKSTQTFTISEPDPINIALTIQNVTCNGAGDGEVWANVTGGVSPYTSDWSSGHSGSIWTDAAPGDYSVTITDFNGCQFATDFTINEPDEINLSFNVTGNNIDLHVDGGLAPYSYIWSTGDTTEDVTGLINGSYNVTVSDINGCYTEGTTSIDVATELKAEIGCCQDTTIDKFGTAKIHINLSIDGNYVINYKEIYGHKKSDFIIRTVTTTDNPYIINVSPLKTTTYELVNVSINGEPGKVCGRATVGVNNNTGNCAKDCFDADVLSITDEGNCKKVKLKIVNDGSCRFGLSHVNVSIPCGVVSNVSNSRGFPVEYGLDPTTLVIGFKVDDVSGFGQAKNGNRESFTVEYTICPTTECSISDCLPLVGYKAGQCVFYKKAAMGSGITNAEVENENGNSSVIIGEEDEVVMYPNPVDIGQTVFIKRKAGKDKNKDYGNGNGKEKDKAKGNLMVKDKLWNTLIQKTFSLEEDPIELPELKDLKPGIYYCTVIIENSTTKTIKLIVK